MSGYKLFSQLMSYFYRHSTCFIVFIPRPVTTSFLRFFCVFLRFFAVPVHGSCILKLSGTGPVCGPSKKGNRTETGLDFKALILMTSVPLLGSMVHHSGHQRKFDMQLLDLLYPNKDHQDTDSLSAFLHIYFEFMVHPPLVAFSFGYHHPLAACFYPSPVHARSLL